MWSQSRSRSRGRGRNPAALGSEGDDALGDEALELAAAAAVGRREVVVLLVHVLGLEEDERRDLPARGEGLAVGTDVLRHPLQPQRRGVVAPTDVEPVPEEA